MQSGQRTGWVICTALTLLVAAVFAQTLWFDFVNYDDNLYVTGNRFVRDGLSLQGFSHTFAGQTLDGSNWIPLTWLSLSLDATVFGTAAGGFHFTNVALHVLNTLLLYTVLHAMTGAAWRSGLVAALFAVHPLHVESVAWIAERKDLLSTLFGLLAFWAYAEYAMQPESSRTRRAWYAAALLAFVASLMSKQMLVTLPFLLLLLDYWPLRRLQWDHGAFERRPPDGNSRVCALPLKRLVLEKVPFLLVALVFSAIALATQQQAGTVSSLSDRSLATRAANAVVVYALYLVKAFRPVDLAVFYPYPEMGIPAWQMLLSGSLLLAISGITLRQAQRRPYLLVGWLWYLGTLVPVIGIVQIGDQQLADRYTYVPLIGIAVALVWLAADFAEARAWGRKLAPAAAGVVVLLLAAIAFVQTSHWRDSETLFRHVLATSAESSLAHNNLGSALEAKGRADEAFPHYQRALEIDPTDALSHVNLGSALEKNGSRNQALVHLRTAIELDPEMSLAHSNLGGLLARVGQTEEAITHLQEAVRLNPQAVQAHYNLAVVLSAAGRPEDAIRHNLEALDIKPDYAAAHNNLANELARTGQIDAAIEHVQEAVRLDPLFAQAHYNLGALLMRNRQDRETAMAHLNEAARLDPAIARALQNMRVGEP